MTKIVLNGREVEVDPKKPLIAACHEHAENVPMYCYHPGLTPVGSCRICQVEVTQGEMPPRVVVACRTPVTEGMVVDTESGKAHEARRQCLEFLLKNHPLDCPICDKAGECDRQDYAFTEGQGEGRSVEPRRKLDKRKSLGDVIVLDEERCILCSRCVRFFEDVTEKPQLTVCNMGARSVISTFMDRPLEGNYQGNLADICPVGALTLKKFRFQARVWNLSKTPSTCGECSRGCAISVEVLRRREVKRIRPRYDADVNRWWMCDHGRFAFDRLNDEDRLFGAAELGSQGLVSTPLERALDLAADLLLVAREPTILVSPWITVEEAELVQRIAERFDTNPSFVSPPASDLADDFLHTGDPCPNRRGLTDLGFTTMGPGDARAELKASRAALLVGERVVELLGEDPFAGARELRCVVLDTAPVHSPHAPVQIGVPNAAERQGTWINVEGKPRTIAPARQAPEGVPLLTRSLAELAGRLAPEEVEA